MTSRFGNYTPVITSRHAAQNPTRCQAPALPKEKVRDCSVQDHALRPVQVGCLRDTVIVIVVRLLCRWMVLKLGL
jgi:hypothetical protein